MGVYGDGPSAGDTSVRHINMERRLIDFGFQFLCVMLFMRQIGFRQNLVYFCRIEFFLMQKLLFTFSATMKYFNSTEM